MKVENTLRVKEDVDFKLSSRKLQAEVDRLTRELESAEAGKKAAERRRGGGAAKHAETAATHAAELQALADQLADARRGKEAAAARVEALALELALVAENGAALEAAQEEAREAERAELARRWEEEEAERREEEDAWRAEAETYRRERDEIVEAVVLERARWSAERAAAEAGNGAGWDGGLSIYPLLQRMERVKHLFMYFTSQSSALRGQFNSRRVVMYLYVGWSGETWKTAIG